MWTRRGLLKSGGLALFATSLGGLPVFLNRAAQAATPKARRKVLVTIFQRGAMDGLMAVTPMGDEALHRLRPNLFFRDGLIDLDGRFSLHPSFSDLAPLFREGRLAVVHGVGSPDTTRSHFDAQDYMETGRPGEKSASSGWLNRASGLLGHEGAPLRTVAMQSKLPRTMAGEVPALAIDDLNTFGIQVPNKEMARKTKSSFEVLYKNSRYHLLQGVGDTGFEALEMVSRLDVKGYQSAVDYPNGPLGRRLKQIALLIKSDVGLEVAFTESEGWDTHLQQGTKTGTFAQRASELSKAVAAFWEDLGTFQDDVVVMTMTEFGRTVHQNGSMGTDHGRGSCLFVLGNGVLGGKVHGEMPEKLEKDALEDGRDLPVTTDFRAVFAGVAGGHLGIGRGKDGVLFPGWDGDRLVLVK